MSRRIVKLSIALLLVLFVLAAPAAARTIRTGYAGTEYCSGSGAEGRSWISQGGVLHTRGSESLCYEDVDDPRLSGDSLVTANYNFKQAEPPVYVHGPMWGTMRIDNEGGYWEGHWVGERTEESFSYISAVLRGYGDYDGLQARAHYVRETTDPFAPFSVHGVVMNPGGK